MAAPSAQPPTATEPLFPEVPECLPRKGNRASRAIGRWLLKVLGWRVTGSFPPVPKIVVAVGPHTSNWDFIVGMAGIMATGIDARFLMKKEAFIWPFSKFFIWLGGEPLDRKARENTLEQIVQHFHCADQLWLGIAPEGTRRKVDHWKKGFLRIADQAQVPVLLLGFDYANKEFVLDKLWSTTGNYEADADAIRDYMCTRFVGRYPRYQ